MQLNWLYFCGICQMMQLKVQPKTTLGCNHQSIRMPHSYSLYVQLLWYPMYYPEGIMARVFPVQWSKPYSILSPLKIRTRAAGFKIISGDHYTIPLHTEGMTMKTRATPDTPACIWWSFNMFIIIINNIQCLICVGGVNPTTSGVSQPPPPPNSIAFPTGLANNSQKYIADPPPPPPIWFYHKSSTDNI